MKITQMFGATSYKTKQFFFVLIKLSIVVGALYYIYFKLTSNEHLEFSAFVDFLQKNVNFTLKNIIFLFLLGLFNWFLEIIKWQTLASNIEKISFFSALEQSLGSLTASLFTPNRVGEYGVKVLYFSKSNRKKIALMNLLGNSIQMAVTCILGSIGLFFFVNTYNPEINYMKLLRFASILLLLAFFGYYSFKTKLFEVKGFPLSSIASYLKHTPLKLYFKTFLLALARYLVFSFQFFMLLHIFGAELNYINAMTLISSMYLLASVIPSVFIFDVVIKGSVAVYLFDLAGISQLMTLSVILLMWLLNFVLPSLIGAVFVMKFKLPDFK